MKIAIIGLGSIGRRHFDNFRALGCEVFAWDSSPAAMLGFYDPIYCTRTLDEALDGVDGVVICTPPNAHIDMLGIASLSCDKIMVEKPLAHSVGEAKSGFADYHRVLVAYPWRHWPPIQHVKALVESGAIGTIKAVSVTYGAHLDRHYPTHAPARTDSYMRRIATGGGCLLDCSHAIDFVRWICGEITDVSGVVERRVIDMEADDAADLMVRFASDATGIFRLGLYFPEVRGELEIVGTEGVIRWSRTANTVTVNGKTTQYTEPLGDMYVHEARHFLAVIRGEAEPVCSGWDGLQTLRVCEAARRASDEKRWVTV